MLKIEDLATTLKAFKHTTFIFQTNHINSSILKRTSIAKLMKQYTPDYLTLHDTQTAVSLVLHIPSYPFLKYLKSRTDRSI